MLLKSSVHNAQSLRGSMAFAVRRSPCLNDPAPSATSTQSLRLAMVASVIGDEHRLHVMRVRELSPPEEIQEAIRHMEGDDGARLHVLAIDRECLKGERWTGMESLENASIARRSKRCGGPARG